ncbi:hypothetical protein LC55x_0699 [Lysobacter capsici]|nr:hypothetical protein LC55x_0699 [Lysobacter capsici]
MSARAGNGVKAACAHAPIPLERIRPDAVFPPPSAQLTKPVAGGLQPDTLVRDRRAAIAQRTFPQPLLRDQTGEGLRSPNPA